MEPAFVVDLVDEARKRVNDIGERLVAAEIDFLGLERLYKALCLGVVIGVAAPLASEVPKPSRNRRRTSCSTGAAALSHALSHSLSHSLGRMTCGSPARAGDLGRRAGRATCAVGGEILYLIIKIKSSIFAV